MEEGFVNLESRMPQNQYCRAHQAVRNRNHVIRHEGNKLGLEAGWRSQHAVDDDAAAYHDRAWQIRRPHGSKQVCECC